MNNFTCVSLERYYVRCSYTDLLKYSTVARNFIHLAAMICGLWFHDRTKRGTERSSWYRIKVITTKGRYPRQRVKSRRDTRGLHFRRLNHAASIRWIVFHDPTKGRATLHASGERGSRRNAATLDGGRLSWSDTRGLLFRRPEHGNVIFIWLIPTHNVLSRTSRRF